MNEMPLRQKETNEEMPVNTLKAYEAPKIIFRAPLEAMAGLCGSTQPPGKASAGGGCTVLSS